MRFLICFLLLMTSPSLQPASGQTLLAEKPEFHRFVPEGATVEKLAGGFKFLEGPAWDPIGGFLVFSDIPADKMYRYDPATKTVAIFREPSHNANGNFYDSQGNLYTCEHGSRRVSKMFGGRATGTFEFEDPQANPRTSPASLAGTHIVIAERFGDKRLNSPNDVTVKRDGTVWFTDPTYGLENAPKEQATNNVYCLDPKTRELRAVATDFVQPNGLCFSPDEKLLYVADSGQPQHVRVFEVTADNRLADGRVFCRVEGLDGMRCDRHGNLFSSARDGVHVIAPDGARLGKILVPESPANLCFGGPKRNRLFMAASQSIYALYVNARGAP